jgi:hypothetical protein
MPNECVVPSCVYSDGLHRMFGAAHTRFSQSLRAKQLKSELILQRGNGNTFAFLKAASLGA